MPTRAILKQRAKEQIKGKVWLLFLCLFIFTVISGVISSVSAHLTFNVNDVLTIDLNDARVFDLGIRDGFGPIVGSILDLILFVFIIPSFALGLAQIFLKVSRMERPAISEVFGGFSQWSRAFFLTLLIEVFTFLWALLFIIPGIIKAISYSMSYYILADKPDLTAREALNESKRITKGHKAELFILALSFIPWLLLVSITFGIAGIYVLPYIETTVANYYQELKNQTA
ncbi:hypothetical protein FACS1894111_06460 [Clostridia bacterium]|nr:hypothetical protein FACS1894111_06460 [Clostridia bacterium]